MPSKHDGGQAAPPKLLTPFVRPAAYIPSKPPNESNTAVSGAHAAVSVPSATAATSTAKDDAIMGSSSQVPVEISSESESESATDDEADEDGDEGEEYEEEDGFEDEDMENGTARVEAKKTNSANPVKDKLQKDGGKEKDSFVSSTVYLPMPKGPVDRPPSPSSPNSPISPTSPTFGDLLRAASPSPVLHADPPNKVPTIDVAAYALEAPSGLPTPTTSVMPRRSQVVSAPPATSLATVLAQALRSDDADLLESCLRAHDLPSIRATIERLDSSLAIGLLAKLAARVHRRPGRAGTLMTWMQWTLVVHGGALGGRPEVVRQLDDLQRVLEERARGLGSLLVLKGKLDLLEAQMQLRRSATKRDARGGDDEGEDVIYVEGEESRSPPLTNGVTARRRGKTRDVEVADSSDEDAHVVVNGVASETDDEEDDGEGDADGSDGSGGSAAASSADEVEVDYDDVEDSQGEDEDSDGETGPPAKVQKVSNFAAGR